MYTREMEERHAETEAALHKAVEAHKELDNARQRRLNQLGDLVLRAPQQSGTMGAGKWAIGHADKLTELLAPFTSELSAGEADTLVSTLRRIAAIGNEDGLPHDEYQQRLIAAAGYARAALAAVGR